MRGDLRVVQGGAAAAHKLGIDESEIEFSVVDHQGIAG